MRGRGRGRESAGITIVELVITASIVAVALLAVATVFPVALGNINVGGDETAAMGLAQAFIELLRNSPWATVQAYNGFDSTAAAPCNAIPAAGQNDCVTWLAQVQNLGQAQPGGRPVPGQAQVQVTFVTGPSGQQLATVVVVVNWSTREASWMGFGGWGRGVRLVTRLNQRT